MRNLKGAEAWAKYLEDKQLPVLKETLEKILSITESDRATVNRLAEAVLEDADLSSSVLKLANSALYNPSHTSISTVSRSIMVVGFNSVKSMAITSLLVDRISKCKQRDNIYRCLAKSLHASIQAKYLAQDLPIQAQEEIFVAALLSNLAEAAFWASDHSLAEELSKHPELLASDPSQTQREFLGTTFKAITRHIAKNWNLGALIDESLSSPKTKEAKLVATAINIANLFEQASQLNINVDFDKASIKLCMEYRNESPGTITRALQKNRKAAIKMAETLGIKQVGQYLEDSPQTFEEISEPNPKIQIECLQNITTMQEQRFDDRSVETVLKSLHQGIGFERAAIFLSRVNASKNTMSAINNYQFQLLESTGIGRSQWFNGRMMQISQALPINKVFSFEEIGKTISTAKLHILDSPFSGHTVKSLAALLPISRGYQVLVYADRCSLAEITDDQKQSFELLIYTLFARMTLYSSQQKNIQKYSNYQ